MDDQDLKLLGFDSIQEILREFSECLPGSDRVSQFLPEVSPQKVARRVSFVAECRRACEEGVSVGLGQLGDPSLFLPALHLDGAAFEPEQFLEILGWAEASLDLCRKFTAEEFPLLSEFGDGLTELSLVAREIRRVLDQTGQVREDADPELGRVRRQIIEVRKQAQAHLQAYLSGDRSRYLIDEPFVTQRNQRSVIPVKSQFQGQVPGIVHGSSSSGATLFVEPFSCVELNNRILALEDREREIIERILRRLGEVVRSRREPLETGIRRIAEYDAVRACARFGIRYRCGVAQHESSGELRIVGARHPLLMRSIGDETVVPISVELDRDHSVLVISGPNAGGKTVALKTVGLLTLMAQAGLPVPADEFRAPWFSRILCDIGDRQSIAQSLSTFSAHILRVLQMIESLDRDSLILLDELGTGTDPVFGASLGTAVLDFFRRAGAKVIVTTHLAAVKQYAAVTEGVVNASVELDPVDLKPTFRLRFGAAGVSNALEIAEQLGIPPAILEDARVRLTTEERDLERYHREARLELAALQEERLKLERERLDLTQRAADATRRQEEKIRELEKRALKSSELWEKYFRTQTEAFLAKTQERLEATRIRNEARLRQQALREEFRAQIRAELEMETSAHPADGSAFEPGDSVLHLLFREKGTILERNGDQLVVMVAGKRVKAKPSDLRRLDNPLEGVRKDPHIRLDVVEEVEPELNLVGQTVEDALDQINKLLDRAVLAGVEQIRLIHGFGTGRLRNAIIDFLGQHPQVRSFRTEGGGTFVYLHE